MRLLAVIFVALFPFFAFASDSCVLPGFEQRDASGAVYVNFGKGVELKVYESQGVLRIRVGDAIDNKEVAEQSSNNPNGTFALTAQRGLMQLNLIANKVDGRIDSWLVEYSDNGKETTAITSVTSGQSECITFKGAPATLNTYGLNEKNIKALKFLAPNDIFDQLGL